MEKEKVTKGSCLLAAFRRGNATIGTGAHHIFQIDLVLLCELLGIRGHNDFSGALDVGWRCRCRGRSGSRGRGRGRGGLWRRWQGSCRRRSRGVVGFGFGPSYFIPILGEEVDGISDRGNLAFPDDDSSEDPIVEGLNIHVDLVH
jgi:hypothetical protein